MLISTSKRQEITTNANPGKIHALHITTGHRSVCSLLSCSRTGAGILDRPKAWKPTKKGIRSRDCTRLGSQATWEQRPGEKAAGCLAEEKCISSLLACLFLSAPDRLSSAVALVALLLQLFLAVLPWPFLAAPPLLLRAL